MNKEAIKALAEDPVLLEVGRRAVEDVLIDMRDSRMFTIRNNGLVIKEKDGSESSIIRMGAENAVSLALRAIAAISDAELAALTAVFEAKKSGTLTPELVLAYEAEHLKAKGS